MSDRPIDGIAQIAHVPIVDTMFDPEPFGSIASLAIREASIDLPEARHQANTDYHNEHVHERPDKRRDHVHGFAQNRTCIRVRRKMEYVRQLQQDHVLDGIVRCVLTLVGRGYGRYQAEQVLDYGRGLFEWIQL